MPGVRLASRGTSPSRALPRASKRPVASAEPWFAYPHCLCLPCLLRRDASGTRPLVLTPRGAVYALSRRDKVNGRQGKRQLLENAGVSYSRRRTSMWMSIPQGGCGASPVQAGRTAERSEGLRTAVQKGARYALAVAVDHPGRAGALLHRVAEVATGSGVHGCGEHKVGGEGQSACRSTDGHDLVFKRFPQVTISITGLMRGLYEDFWNALNDKGQQDTTIDPRVHTPAPDGAGQQ